MLKYQTTLSVFILRWHPYFQARLKEKILSLTVTSSIKNIELLLKQKMSIHEVFFFASMIHLVFVKIHPWNDGNGRSGRLLEKWFLGQKLGDKAWFVPIERNYYKQHKTYYKNISALGIEYPKLDYSKALPFLLMLPQSVTVTKK